MKPISIQLYTVRQAIQEHGLLPVLREIGQIGYAGVEGGAGNGLTATEFRRVVEDLGMVVSSTWGDLGTEEGLDQLIDACQTLGTTFACGGFWIPDFETVEAIDATADKLARAIDKLSGVGLTLGLHNHWMEFEERDGELVIDRLLKRLPSLTLELDIYWAANFGAHLAHEQVRRLSAHIALLHVKDGGLVRGEPMLPVGSGTLDIPACIRASDPAWLIVELDEYAGEMMEAVRESYRYLVGSGLGYGRPS